MKFNASGLFILSATVVSGENLRGSSRSNNSPFAVNSISSSADDLNGLLAIDGDENIGEHEYISLLAKKQPTLKDEEGEEDSKKVEKGFNYPHIILTSYPVKELEGGRVQFTEEDWVSGQATKAHFLRNITLVDDSSSRVWEATPISVEEAAKEIIETDDVPDGRSPIFVTHGFNSKVSSSLTKFDRFEKDLYLVPIIWPSNTNYYKQQWDIAREAGPIFRNFFDTENLDEVFPRKSLVMHSMANHLWFHQICSDGIPNITFDNMYMVAADIAFDVFQTTPSANKFGNNKHAKAENFFGMLGEGKVYVLYNEADQVLAISSQAMNNEGRIGNAGYDCPDRNCWERNSDLVPAEFQSRLENIDVTSTLQNLGYGLGHSYQWDPTIIKFYHDKVLNGGTPVSHLD